MILRTKLVLFLSVVLAPLGSPLAQDLIIAKSGDQIHGELKQLNENVLIVETPYSDSDLQIDWRDIENVRSDREFLVILTTLEKEYVSFRTSERARHIFLIFPDGSKREVSLRDIVYINQVEGEFEDRFSASVSAGFNVTKANNDRQFSTRANVRYYTRTWNIDSKLNIVRNVQDNAEPVRRTDASLNVAYLLTQRWFGSVRNDFLSNTQQSLRLRNTHTLAIGNLFVSNSGFYLAGSIGGTFNQEDYTNETEVITSTEGYAGTVFNVYDVGDLDILTKLDFFPSLRKSDRYRINFDIDLKYDLPLDFFVKLGYTLNYDSKPPNGGPNDDFVFQTTIGWDF